jgi:hypothetical protein
MYAIMLLEQFLLRLMPRWEGSRLNIEMDPKERDLKIPSQDASNFFIVICHEMWNNFSFLNNNTIITELYYARVFVRIGTQICGIGDIFSSMGVRASLRDCIFYF